MAFKKKFNTFAKPESVDSASSVDLGKKKQITIRKFNGIKLVDIREYYEKDGEKLPGKKGISLTEDSWRALVENISLVNDALDGLDGEKKKVKQDVDEQPPRKKAKKESLKKEEDDEVDIDEADFEDVDVGGAVSEED